MKNWSRLYQWNPREVLYPTSEEAVQQIIRNALQSGSKIRCIGSGHSFTPLCVTGEILISLDNYQGIVELNKAENQATVKAGTKLHLLGALLFEQGLALENMGDVDRQSIAGTISTGTHGTGLAFGTMATQVVKLRFVNGHGEMVECSERLHPEIFKAAQTSLGALGIITQVTLQCVPVYTLQLQNNTESLESVHTELEVRNRQNRNFEFYWFPHTCRAWTKTANLAECRPQKQNTVSYLTGYVVENYAFSAFCHLGNSFPNLNRKISAISARSIPQVTKSYYSHKVYASPRLVRFHEMEYNIPLEAHAEVFNEVVKQIEKSGMTEHFPIENRAVKGDDIWLSPAFQRDSAYIACHCFYKKNPRPYFSLLEPIFRAYGGRPHWGKMHTLTFKDFVDAYPQFPQFLQQREIQDPQKIFLNPYLIKIFEP